MLYCHYSWLLLYHLCNVSLHLIYHVYSFRYQLPALEAVTVELDSPSIMVTLSNSVYMLFMGIAVSFLFLLNQLIFTVKKKPIFYSSISDHWKIRRSVYFFSIVIYTVGSLAAVFANDIYVLLGMRILQATGISSAWAIGAG